MKRYEWTGLRRLLIVVTAAAALVTLATFLGRHAWFFELFTHFRLQLAGGAIVLAAGAAFLRMPASALSLLAMAAVHAAYMHAYVWPGAGGVQAEPATFRVMSANVRRSNHRFSRLLDLISETRPDIVGLVETDSDWLEGLAALRSDYPHRVLRPQEGSFGLMLLSRFPMRELAESPYTHEGTQTAVMAEIDIGGQATNVVLTHAMAPMTPAQARARNAQLQHLSGMFRARRDRPGILCGDLNTTPWAPHYGVLESGTGLVNASRGKGYLPTWPVQPGILRIPIDHCLVSTQFEVHAVRTGPSIGSDHLPLIVDISFAGVPEARH